MLKGHSVYIVCMRARCVCELNALEVSRNASRVESMNELTKRVITLNTDPRCRTPRPRPMEGGSEERE